MRQLEKPEFFVLTLRLTHPTGYKQIKLILAEICVVRIAQQTTKIDMILKITNHKSQITTLKFQISNHRFQITHPTSTFIP